MPLQVQRVPGWIRYEVGLDDEETPGTPPDLFRGKTGSADQVPMTSRW